MQLCSVFVLHIYFVRDGVGEGQLDYIINHEIQAIKSCIKHAGLTEDLKFTYIVVNKKINTKVC